MLLLVLAASLTSFFLERGSEAPTTGQLIVMSAASILATRAVIERRKLYGLPNLLDAPGCVSSLALAVVVGAVVGGFTLALMRPGEVAADALEPLGWALGAMAALLAFRSLAGRRLGHHARTGRLATKVAVIGTGPACGAFLRRAASDPSLRVVGVYDQRATRLPALRPGVVVRGGVDELVAHARHEPVDAVVIALPGGAPERIAALRQRLIGISADIVLTPDMAGLDESGAQLALLGACPVIRLCDRPLKDWPAFQKAVLDRTGAAVALVLCLPLMLVIAALVRLDSPGPVLFRQQREGLNGRLFTMLKFRTMVDRPPGDEHLQATRQDCRVTRLGRVLRRCSLDELPQLFNVLRGEMSLVGPRPHLTTTRAGTLLLREVVADYPARHRVRPGITGWAQVNGLRGETRTPELVAARIRHDLYYIENWSLAFDLRILVDTLRREVFARSRNAF